MRFAYRRSHAARAIAITLDFEGLTADGQEVSVHLKDKQVIASLTVDPVWVWKLVKLTSVHNG